MRRVANENKSFENKNRPEKILSSISKINLKKNPISHCCLSNIHVKCGKRGLCYIENSK